MGSEMCIRDSLVSGRGYGIHYWHELFTERQLVALTTFSDLVQDCLLYTSDAADERSSVDLGGRRIIKKKNRDK